MLITPLHKFQCGIVGLVFTLRCVLCLSELSAFPLIEFYFDDPKYFVELDFFLSLQDSTLCSSPYVRCCDCYDGCVERGSCCVDFLWPKYVSSTSNASALGYKDYLARESRTYKEVVCAKITDFPLKNGNVFMVVSCPKNVSVDDQDKVLCERDDPFGEGILSPVLGGDGYIYRNGYCARCHSTSKFAALAISLACREFTPARPGAPLSMVVNNCSLSAQSDFMHLCQGYDRPGQTAEGLSDSSDICKAYNGFIYSPDGVLYKNLDCLRKGSVLSNLQGYSVKNCLPMLEMLGFSVTVSFEKQPTIRVRDVQRNKDVYAAQPVCSNSEKFDVFSDRCIPFNCGSNYAKSAGQCMFRGVASQTATMIDTIMTCIASQSGGLYVVKSLSHNVSLPYLLYTLRGGSLNNTPMQNFSRNVYLRNSEIVLLGIFYDVPAVNTTLQQAQENLDIYQSVSEVYIASNNMLFKNEQYLDQGFISRVMFPGSRLCAKPRLLDSKSINVSRSCVLVTPQSIYRPTEYVTWIHVNATVPAEIAVLVCDGFYAHECHGDWKLARNYTMHSNLSLLTSDGSEYDFSEYLPTVDGISICPYRSIAEKPSWKRLVETVDAFITLIGITISMIAYIWVMVTFLYFKQLRTKFGKCIVSLCLALLVSDIVFLCQLAVKENSIECKSIAILLHYSLLCTHVWAALITFDIAHTLLAGTAARNNESRKVFRRYSLVGWLGSLALVLLAITLDESGALDMEYGAFAGACWIRSLEGRLAFYIIPSYAILAGCLMVLSFTIYKINKQQKENAKVLNFKRDQRNLAKMALKLIFVLGIVELLGLPQGANSAKTSVQKALALFQVLYSFVRGFRGIFIWMFYILRNKKACSLYKDQYDYISHSSTNTGMRYRIRGRTAESSL